MKTVDQFSKTYEHLASLTYPQDELENLKLRALIRQQADSNPIVQRAVTIKSGRDILYFFNVLLWTYDPRRSRPDIPFITWDFQDEFILSLNDHIENGKDLAIDKSRDMGATWMVLGVFLHGWMFRGWDFRIGSRKEQFVDTYGDIDSLFEKLRFMISWIPGWMLPPEFNSKKHATYMMLQNPNRGNSIAGEATNRNFGVGGRKKAILFDEFSKWENDGEAWDKSADTTPCRIALSTPEGLGNKFGWLMNDTVVDVDRYSLWWPLHPEKSKGMYELTKEELREKQLLGGTIRSTWYDRECSRRGSRIAIAQELDMEYLQSGRSFFDSDYLEISSKKQPAKEGFHYVIGADVATGETIGEDPDQSSADVICLETGEQVFTIEGFWKPEVFAEKLSILSKEYNEALVGVERNNIGIYVVSELKKKETPQHVTRVYNRRTEKYVDRLGWETTTTTKPRMMFGLESALIKSDLKLCSKKTVSQLRTIVTKPNGAIEGASGYHDDKATSIAIAWQMYLHHPAPRKREKKLTPAQTPGTFESELNNLKRQKNVRRGTRTLLNHQI